MVGLDVPQDETPDWTPVPPEGAVLVFVCTPVPTPVWTPELAEPPQAARAGPEAPSTTAKTSQAVRAALIVGSPDVEAKVVQLRVDASESWQRSFRMIILQCAPLAQYLHLAAAHALKGDIDEAKTALEEARRLNPKLSVKWLIGPRYMQLFDALRKAGMLEE